MTTKARFLRVQLLWHPPCLFLPGLRLASRTLCSTSVGLAVTTWCQWAESTSRKELWVPLEQAEIQLTWGRLRTLGVPAAPCLVLFEPYWAPAKQGISPASYRPAGEPQESRGRGGRKGWDAGRPHRQPAQVSTTVCTELHRGFHRLCQVAAAGSAWGSDPRRDLLSARQPREARADRAQRVKSPSTPSHSYSFLSKAQLT